MLATHQSHPTADTGPCRGGHGRRGRRRTCPGPTGSSIRCPSRFPLSRFLGEKSEICCNSGILKIPILIPAEQIFRWEIWCNFEILKIPRFIRVQLAGWSSFLFSSWILNPRLGTYLSKMHFALSHFSFAIWKDISVQKFCNLKDISVQKSTENH